MQQPAPGSAFAARRERMKMSYSDNAISNTISPTMYHSTRRPRWLCKRASVVLTVREISSSLRSRISLR